MQRAASTGAAKYDAGARAAYFTPGSPCTHCSRSSSTSPSFIYTHSHSYTDFCTRSYACPNQACAAFRLAVGSGARLSPKYSVSLEQLAEALRHCELQCEAPLELLFAELILGQAEAQRLADDTQSERLHEPELAHAEQSPFSKMIFFIGA